MIIAVETSTPRPVSAAGCPSYRALLGVVVPGKRVKRSHLHPPSAKLLRDVFEEAANICSDLKIKAGRVARVAHRTPGPTNPLPTGLRSRDLFHSAHPGGRPGRRSVTATRGVQRSPDPNPPTAFPSGGTTAPRTFRRWVLWQKQPSKHGFLVPSGSAVRFAARRGHTRGRGNSDTGGASQRLSNRQRFVFALGPVQPREQSPPKVGESTKDVQKPREGPGGFR